MLGAGNSTGILIDDTIVAHIGSMLSVTGFNAHPDEVECSGRLARFSFACSAAMFVTRVVDCLHCSDSASL